MKTLKLLILSLFISFLLLQNSNSQIITIINGSSKEPVQNVALYNSKKNLATLTNEQGKANISIFADNDSIFFQHPSFNQHIIIKNKIKAGDVIALSKKIILIDEFVISASKSRENKKDVANQVDILNQSLLEDNNSPTAADILLSTGNLMIQKTQGGGGSPIIRGFEANRVLLVIDGVRMNNCIYRSGHLQNAITLDNSILDRVEVTYGPTSLIYGSDALGGVIHYYTKDPELNVEKKGNLFKADAFTRYSSANNGKIVHLALNNGFNKIGFLTSVSYKDLGDIRMGDYKNPFYGDFGEVRHYVGQIGRRDTTLVNKDPYLQLNTGYSQIDILQKVKYSPSGYYDFILNLQYSNSSEIDRLDMLNDYSGSDLKYAEYYYGPQERMLASLKSVVKKDNSLFTNLTAILAFQNIDEDRISRKFRKDERLIQEEDVNVYSLNIDLLKLLNERNRLNYGVEVTHNTLRSAGFYENIFSMERTPGEVRYPDDGSASWSYSAYANYKWFSGPKFVFSGGARYHYSSYLSDFLPGGVLPYDQIKINNGATTGSLSVVFTPERSWKLTGILSSGFRNPNVDDYGKVRAKDNFVTVPNPNLRPEYTYNVECGISKTIEGYIQLNATAYYTLLTDAIVRTDFQLNGSDSLEYDGDMYKIITNSNLNKAFIRGISLNVISDLNSNLSFKSTFNLTEGRDFTDDAPMPHIPPVFGRTLVKYTMKKNITEVFVDYNGWKKLEDMSPFGEDNEEEATEHGWPGWYTVNIKSTFHLTELVQMQLGIENIFDSFYKPFASGVAAPGRNFIITLKANLG